jgi:sulfite reductase (ferredoxin)
VEKFREVLEDEYLGRALVDAPPAGPGGTGRPHRRHEPEGASSTSASRRSVAAIDGTTLARLADLSSVRLRGARLTPYQKSC